MRFNVVFVGSVGAGKTSIIKSRMNEDINKHVSTIAVDYIQLNIGKYDISLWDTCGQERFMSLTSSYFMRGHVFVLVHDVADSCVENDLEKWRKEIVDKCPARHTPVIIVVSNKVDITPFCDSSVSEWTRGHSFDHIHTSAKTGENIHKIFTKIEDSITVHQSDWLTPSLPALPHVPESEPSPGCAC